MTESKTIAIIGAGPVGLAAAAHAIERGLTPIVLEKGDSVGHFVRQWGHVPMFSPWTFNMDAASRRILEASGWVAPDPEAYPTGGKLWRDYLDPLARTPAMRNAIRLNAEVAHVGRFGFDKAKTNGRDVAPFEIAVLRHGAEERLIADAVIDTSGTWAAPSPAGAGGFPAAGERQAASRASYGMPDIRGAARARYAGRRTAVIGGGHSAIGTLIELAALAEETPGTRILWLYRGQNIAKAFGGGAADKLAARGALGSRIADLIAGSRITVATGFQTGRFAMSADGVVVTEAGPQGRQMEVDEVIVATGFRPDLSMLRELRVELDSALECPPVLAPLIDPNVHSCGTVRPHGAAVLLHPEKGFYIAGMKSYGRAPTFLLATGYEQVRSIVAELAGDAEAARRVELVLPETGVCSLPGPTATARDESCCGGPPAALEEACCRADEVAKIVGKPGCGCGSKVEFAEA
jgi:thioredoxin reductase